MSKKIEGIEGYRKAKQVAVSLPAHSGMSAGGIHKPEKAPVELYKQAFTIRTFGSYREES